MSGIPNQRRAINELVSYYSENLGVLDSFLTTLRGQVSSSPKLSPYIHSLRWRLKDPVHLREKLQRKFLEATEKGKVLAITEENLFLKVNDLAGLRILHLHTDQLRSIAVGLKDLFEEESYELIEGPEARTWDDESRALFSQMGIATKDSPSLYTSIHYVIRPNRRTKYTCEVQVRTLMEEVWGEVDHTINYPHRTSHVACREQLAALARATSSCSRLVDSIFRSYASLEHQKLPPSKPKRTRARKTGADKGRVAHS